MSTFCANELQHVLAEESSTSTIGPFRLTASAPLCATAAVTLLEGRTILINLTTKGYSILPDDHKNDVSSHTVPAPAGTTFESIDQLLRSVSTLYERRRQEALMAALERVSD